MHDIIIVGGGSAGLVAGIYAARYGMETLILTENVGGLMNDAYPVENYPGFKKISGFELMKKFAEHAKSLGTKIEAKEVKNIEKKRDYFIVSTEDKNYESRAIILATGSKRRKLNIPGEEKLLGKGIHYCAICDAALYKDKIVGVVGGSEAAAQAALLLSEYAKKVYIIYRREKLRAEQIYVKRIEKNEKIEIINNTNVIKAIGKNRLEKVILDKPYKGNKEFNLDGLFIEIGSEPSIGLAKKLGVKLNEKNEIIVNEKCETNIKGVFAAGDVTNVVLKQALTAAAQGAIAANSAYMYIRDKE